MDWLREWIEGLGKSIHGLLMSLVKNEGVASVLVDVLFTVIILAIFFILLRLSRRLFNRFKKALDRWCGTRIPPIKIQDYELISAERLTAALKWLADKAKLVSYLLLLYLFIPIFFSYFPQTRHYVLGYLDYFIAPFKTIFNGIVSFIPNLVFITVTVYVVRYFLKLLQVIFSEIQLGRISFAGFHRDWAQPTYKLSRFLVIVIAIVMVSPYLPGFGSPAFQGLSVFLGILLSLGSTAAIANIVAGAALTYMRPFKIGDRVKIADTMGDVLEKSLLVTRIRTIKNVEVTIPNSMVLGSHMINFSAEAQARRLILYTAVTIGYDVPWRQVQELLITAAQATEGIETDPAPFVLQTSLNDFSVTYELNVYTGNAQDILRIQSELHAQIQDEFNAAGVEIMSPTYSALRDGNQVTIPEDYLPKTYEAKGFRLWPLENLLNLKDPSPTR